MPQKGMECSWDESFRQPEIYVSSNRHGGYSKVGGTHDPRQTITFFEASILMDLHAINKKSPYRLDDRWTKIK